MLAHANAIPAAFKACSTPKTYAKAVQYTLAATDFALVSTWSTVVLIVVLFGLSYRNLERLGEQRRVPPPGPPPPAS